MILYNNDNEIINVLIDYITDDRYTQAILIDGKWGCGKTFFIKNTFLPKLNASKNDSISYKQAYYISLYGINSLNEIEDKIYLTVFKTFFKKKFKISKTVMDKLSLFSKVFNFGVNILNQTNSLGIKIDIEDLPSINDLKKLKDIVLILDDVERCNLNINELLGFVNNLTEHHNIKIILIANEEEISHIEYLKNLPQKYDISLQIMNKPSKGTNASLKNEDLKEILEKETKKIFPPNNFYKKIREKTIGLTIKYETNFENIFNDIINKYVTIAKVRRLFNDSQKDIIKLFENKSHFNIRTLIFSIISYEKIFNIVDDISIESSLNTYLYNEEKEILSYLISKSIEIKREPDTRSKKNNNFLNLASTKYDFVDEYLNKRTFKNKEAIKKQIKSKIEDKQKDDIEFNKQKDSSFSKLQNWIRLEDDDINALLKKLKEDLNDNIYSPNSFGYIIQLLIFLNEVGFKNINYDEYIKLMKNQIENSSYSNELLRYLQSVNFDNQKDKETYDTIIQPLIDTIYNKEQKNTLEQYSFINNAQEWDDKFVRRCNENIELFIMNNAFFYYINVENLLQKIKNASLTEIYNLSSIVRIIYINNNTYKYFKKDKVNLKKLLSKLTDDSTLKINTITRKLALDSLISNLKNVLSKLDTLV